MRVRLRTTMLVRLKLTLPLYTRPPFKAAVLPETVLLTKTILPRLLNAPPPLELVAELPEIVLLAKTILPTAARFTAPPPTLAELPETVLLVRVTVPR